MVLLLIYAESDIWDLQQKNFSIFQAQFLS